MSVTVMLLTLFNDTNTLDCLCVSVTVRARHHRLHANAEPEPIPEVREQRELCWALAPRFIRFRAGKFFFSLPIPPR